MDRRRALAALLYVGGLVLLGPRASLAQRAAVPFIGFINIGSPHERRHLIDAFRQGLKEAGFVLRISRNLEELKQYVRDRSTLSARLLPRPRLSTSDFFLDDFRDRLYPDRIPG